MQRYRSTPKTIWSVDGVVIYEASVSWHNSTYSSHGKFFLKSIIDCQDKQVGNEMFWKILI